MDEYISKKEVLDYLNGYLHSLDKGGTDTSLFDRGQRRALINSRQDILAVKAVNVQSVDRWIRCKDEMPPIACDVLVCYNAGYIDIGYYTTRLWFIRGNSFDKSCVTHWRPLPKPPKEE